FDVCIQDDSDSHKVLVFSSQTGAYRFCCDAASFTGVGLVKIKGKVISLAHYPPDRKLFATIDMTTHRATGFLQFPHATVPCTIIDRNTLDDTCSACSVVGT